MKKAFIFLILLLFLAACSSANAYHETIRESFAEDTEVIRDLVVGASEEGRDFTEEEQDKLDSYISKYENNLDSKDESHAFIMTYNLVEEHSPSLLPSDLEKIESYGVNIQATLEGGFEKYKEINSEDN
ncbi:hypothetical protein [Microbulbifer pacificus]|uniref:hypothetical protein n=1 Tax=Microbulbifer pacificus TaxID=407164 RepID=UPI001319F2A6|nr:hypothetical protein [Microbulbifer pacificus]